MTIADPRNKMIDHGTTAGYHRHIRWDMTPCEPCRAAQARYLREYRLRTGRSHTARISLSSLAALLETASPDVLAKVRAEIGDDRVAQICEKVPA